MRKLIFAALVLSGTAIADDLTIPNTFTAGELAVAADVNSNSKRILRFKPLRRTTRVNMPAPS